MTRYNPTCTSCTNISTQPIDDIADVASGTHKPIAAVKTVSSVRSDRLAGLIRVLSSQAATEQEPIHQMHADTTHTDRSRRVNNQFQATYSHIYTAAHCDHTPW